MNAIHGAIVNNTAEQRFFVTQGGLIGIGPAQLKPGDVVFVLIGGSKSFVLRNTGRVTKAQDAGLSGPRIKMGKTCWELIGDCYVHGKIYCIAIITSTKTKWRFPGIMDGEAFEGAAKLAEDVVHLV